MPSEEHGWLQQLGQVKGAGHHAVLVDLLSWDFFLDFGETGSEVTMKTSGKWVSLGKRCGDWRMCLIIIICRSLIHSTFLFHGTQTFSFFKEAIRKELAALPACLYLETSMHRPARPPGQGHIYSHPEPGLKPLLLKVVLWKGLFFIFFSNVCVHISSLFAVKTKKQNRSVCWTWTSFGLLIYTLFLANYTMLRDQPSFQIMFPFL